MQHVRLGRTGLQVSRICLGTMTFGLQVDEPSSFAILDHAAEKGITFLDTADAYPLGGAIAADIQKPRFVDAFVLVCAIALCVVVLAVLHL